MGGYMGNGYDRPFVLDVGQETTFDVKENLLYNFKSRFENTSSSSGSSNSSSLTVLSGTWNVGGKSVSEDIAPWLMRGLQNEDGAMLLPDVVMVGFQEVVGLSDKKRQCGYVLEGSRLDRQCGRLYSYTKDNKVKAWRLRVEKCLTRMAMFAQEQRTDAAAAAIATATATDVDVDVDSKQNGTLGVDLDTKRDANSRADTKEENYGRSSASHKTEAEDEYCCIMYRQMVGVLSLVYIRRKWMPKLDNLKIDQLGVGFMGAGKNKGAIACWFEIDGKTFLHLNVHLESGQKAVGARNANVKVIRESLIAKHKITPDYVIFAGDMNYRLDIGDMEIATQAIRENDLKLLLDADQLKKQMQASTKEEQLFTGFHESPITFPPTYRFLKFSHKYDQGQSGKIRIPAWCDRILYSAKDASTIAAHFYTAAPLVSSDHKPVSALHEMAL